MRIACVGAATARAVHTQLGLGTDFQPQVQSAAGMLAEFEKPATEPAAVLVLEGSNARPTLREGLKNLGWDSHRCVLYDMVPAEQVAPGELSLSTARALVQGNAADAPAPETPALDVLVVTAPPACTPCWTAPPRYRLNLYRPNRCRRWLRLGRVPPPYAAP